MNEEFYFRSVSPRGTQKLRRIRAETFELAKEKAIELFTHIKHFKQTMDLITALDRAAKASSKTKRPYYISVEQDGENEGECTVQTAPIGFVTHKFVNGVEDKSFTAKKLAGTDSNNNDSEVPVKQKTKVKKSVTMEPVTEVIEEAPTKEKNKIKTSKTKEVMSTKVAVKKSSKVVKPAKKVLTPKSKETKIPRGNNMFLTQAEWNKVDAILKKDGKTFSGWSRELVQAKIK